MKDPEIVKLRQALDDLRRDALAVTDRHERSIQSFHAWSVTVAERLGENVNQSQMSAWREAVDKVHSYTNLLLGLGYGGMLAIWTQSDEVRLLYPNQFMLAGGLILLSLLIFLGGEAYGAWLMMKAIGGKELTDENLAARDKAEDEAAAVGRWMFVPTVVSGFGGGLGMLGCYVFGLLG